MLKRELRKVNCGTSTGTPWAGLRKQMDKPGLQCLVSPEEPADPWCDGSINLFLLEGLA